MRHTTTRNKRRGALRIFALVLIGSLVLPIVLMNLTPGHLRFADTDGCTCVVTYSTHASLAACEEERTIHCYGLWTQELLASLSILDLNK